MEIIELCLVMLPNPALANPKMYYSLGILYLAAVSEKVGYKTVIHDCRDGYKPFPEAKYYGFSATTPEFPYACKLSKGLKGKTIIGGAHASLLPKDCLGQFDFTVVGEGEEVILDILSGKMRYPIITGQRIRNLDDIPFPAWDCFPIDAYAVYKPSGAIGAVRTMPILSCRGCVYKCNFCYRMDSGYRMRAMDAIIDEIKQLQKDYFISFFRLRD